ncbi:MAG: hypothetical protein ACRC1K_12410, partial [Planctomycetia bacterium]
TDDEISAYYEKNKEEFKVEAAKPSDRMLPGAPTDEVDVPLPPAKKAAAPKTEPAKPEPAEPKKDDAPKVEEPKADAKPAEPAKEEAKPAEPKAEAPKAEAKPAGGAVRSAKSLTALIAAGAFFADVPAPAETPKAETPKVEEPKAEAPKAEASKAEVKADEKPVDAPKVEEPKVEAKPAEAPKTESPKAETKPIEVPPADPKAAATPAAPPYKPLEAVRDEIRKKLLREKAGKVIAGSMDKIIDTTFRPYLDRYTIARSEYAKKNGSEALDKFVPPEGPDLAAVAKAEGFNIGSTGLVSREAAAKIPGLGTASRVNKEAVGDGSETFLEMAFEPGSLFRGRLVRANDGKSYYLYWKTDDDAPSAPTFEQAKPKLIDAWRKQQAAPRAKVKADELAEAVRKADGDFAKGLGADSPYKPFTTKPFTEGTGLDARLFGFGGDQRLDLNRSIPEIGDVGVGFIQSVFAAKKGDVLVLPDAESRNYYLVKVTEREEPPFDKFVSDYNLEMSVMRNGNAFARQQKFFMAVNEAREAIRAEAGFQEVARTKEPTPTESTP